jgi:outer membrane protein TolC
MRIPAIMLALALILGQKPTPKTTPVAPTSVNAEETWRLALPEAIRVGLDNPAAVDSICVGAQTIPVGGFEPAAMPKISRPGTSVNPEPDEDWNLSLQEAIRIGLDNSDVVRVLSIGPPMILDSCFSETPFTVVGVKPPPGFDVVIAPLNRADSAWKFKADVMAHVRSIEQTYWALWQRRAALKAREAAVKQGEEFLFLRRERTELDFGRSSCADVAEAEQQLENFKLNLVTATCDVITTERQLRNILGLPPADNRRIVTATSPIEARVEPDWETSVREMLASQPDLAQQKVVARLAELQLLLARHQAPPMLSPNALGEFKDLGRDLDQAHFGLAEYIRQASSRPCPLTSDSTNQDDAQWRTGLSLGVPICGRLLVNVRQELYQLLRQRASLQQITHQTTHSLARVFLEVDANYKQFRSAQRLRGAAQTRLEAARAQYEEGRLTVDRLLDAIAQSTNAIAQEAQYKATYNTSLAALEEAKGTLLAYDKIAVADPPPARKPYIGAKAGDVKVPEIEVEVNPTLPADPGF